MNTIIVLSGPIAAGKSTLSAMLAARHGMHVVKTNAIVREHIQNFTDAESAKNAGRAKMQTAGAQLDRVTQGQWIASTVQKWIGVDGPIIVDSVRTTDQLAALRRLGQRVLHIHLRAPHDVLARRAAQRGDFHGSMPITECEQLHAVFQDGEPQDTNNGALERTADLCMNTAHCTAEDVFVRACARLGLYGTHEQLVDVLVGGQWGSEGKGQVSGYLAPEYDVLVRVGGPNAGHKVYELPKPYTFYHLPSGTRANRRAQIVLGPAAVLGLPKLMEEIGDCALSGSGRLHIDPQAMIIQPEDIEFENSLVKSIGSTGQGVGSATARKALRGADGHWPGGIRKHQLAADVPELREFIRPTLEVLDGAFARGQRVFLEGTQGTTLSLHHGAYPYVTSRDTTVSGTLSDAGIAPTRVRKSIMVCRSYPIRVMSVEGSSGPMGTEIDFHEVAQRSGFDAQHLITSEKTTTTKRNRRVAEFSWQEFRRSVSLNAPTDIALTFADYFGKENQEARRFEQLNSDAVAHVNEMEAVSGAPVSMIATRFHFRSIIDRRRW